MKISAAKLLTEGFDLELPHDGRESDRVQLARGSITRGTYAHSNEEIHLDGLAADDLEATLIRFLLDHGKIESAPLVLRGAELDCRIARGPLRGRARLVGSFGARELQARGATVDLGSPQIRVASLDAAAVAFMQSASEGMAARAGSVVATTLNVLVAGSAAGAADTLLEASAIEITGLALRSGTDGSIRLELGAVEARNGKTSIGATTFAFTGISAKNLVLSKGATGLSVTAGAVVVRGLEISVGGTVLHASEIEIARGLRYDDKGIAIEHVAVSDATFEVRGLARSGGSGSVSAKSAKVSPGGASASSIDWRFLDGLGGDLHVDVTVDAKVPVIKRRLATHELRIAIAHGVIDFHELERDLSILEDAILDFEFKGDRLILEKDLPLIPFDNETLVTWMLDEEGKQLASDRRVRLRTLVHPILPQKAPTEPAKPSSFELLRLDFDPIEADLRLLGPGRFSMPGGSVVRFGTEQRAAIGRLQIKGAVRHRVDQPLEPGSVDVHAAEVCIGIHDLPVGERRLSIDEVSVEEISKLSVVLEGVSPTAAHGAVRNLVATNVALFLPPA